VTLLFLVEGARIAYALSRVWRRPGFMAVESLKALRPAEELPYVRLALVAPRIP
jgi:hypothetical protein